VLGLFDLKLGQLAIYPRCRSVCPPRRLAPAVRGGRRARRPVDRSAPHAAASPPTPACITISEAYIFVK
jgi:hypothetical protein